MSDAADAALAAALDDTTGQPLVDRRELRTRTGASDAVLDAAEREGFVVPHETPNGPRYTSGDVAAVAAGMTLVDEGVPLSELLALARRLDGALREVAEEAVEVFARFVRDPVLAESTSEDEAGRRLAEAFRRMLPATSDVVAHRFRRLLLLGAVRRLRDDRGGEPT